MRKLLTAVWLSICVFVASGALATKLDLSTAGSSGPIDRAWYLQYTATAGGSGNIGSFVRYQAANKSVTQGYNTDGAFQFDEKPGNFTHSIRKNDVPLVHFGGVAYREFLFDINESGGNQSPLSLDEVQIYVSDVGDLDDPDFPFGAGVATLVYDMDRLEDSHVELDAALSGPGSGQLDMILLVPDDLFVNDFGANPNLYLYSLVGEQGGFLDNTSGFEEWAYSTVGGIIPEPGTAPLAGLGLLVLTRYAARRRAGRHRRRT
jgi:hypothetical protein